MYVGIKVMWLGTLSISIYHQANGGRKWSKTETLRWVVSMIVNKKDVIELINAFCFSVDVYGTDDQRHG